MLLTSKPTPAKCAFNGDYVFGKEDGYQKQTNFSHNHLYTYDEWAEARAKKEVVIRLHKLGLTSISHSRISYSSTTLNAVCDLLEEVIEYGELRSDTPPA